MNKLLGGAALFLSLFSPVLFAEITEYHIQLKDHLFSPSRISIPAQKKVKLVIDNQDNTPEEFDSFSLNREKVIFAHHQAIIFIGPLEPGEYPFFGEYNPNTARGIVIVRDNTQGSPDAN